MNQFAIIEVDDGLTVVEVHDFEQPEEAATREGGILVDPGPFETYEQACDAMLLIDWDEEDEETA